MLHAQPMQQRDQPGPALIGDTALFLDPGANLAGRPRQRLGDPGLQLVLLLLPVGIGEGRRRVPAAAKFLSTDLAARGFRPSLQLEKYE